MPAAQVRLGSKEGRNSAREYDGNPVIQRYSECRETYAPGLSPIAANVEEAAALPWRAASEMGLNFFGLFLEFRILFATDRECCIRFDTNHAARHAQGPACYPKRLIRRVANFHPQKTVTTPS